ncbi:MAG: hypothetical protein RLZZ618_3651 [Pseudomonadota bacterium]|jgi:uncharacterized flavoprotein (TIGR03862 family)
MAAEVLAEGGAQVTLFDSMPSVGRKFLLAGKGGLNLTHAEAAELFGTRYGARATQVAPWLDVFGAQALRSWAEGLGVPTFVGSSGRVFPVDMKSAPLLRAWLHRLRVAGVQFRMRHRWLGWTADAAASGVQALRFDTPDGEVTHGFDAVVLALGGGSWARLGSDGAWMPVLADRGVELTPLLPSNCGFEVGPVAPDGTERPGWTEHFGGRYAGHPMKGVAIAFTGSDGRAFQQQGEFVVTDTGIEGSLVYAVSALLRDQIMNEGSATLHIDLLPGRSLEWVTSELAHPRGPRSLSTHLKARLGLHGVKAGLLYELVSKADMNDPVRLAGFIKALPLRVVAPRPLNEAISSAGGVRFEAMDAGLALSALSDVFCAGEMIDWEAPTGGYLLTACMASGRVAGQAALAWTQAKVTQ